MRLVTVFVVSATGVLPPAFAGADPIQALPGPITQESVSASTDAQVPPAPTAPPPSAPTIAKTAPESVIVRANAVDLDQIVCKQLPPKTGSRLGGGRECHTLRQWNQQMRESQDITRHQQRMGFVGR